MKAPRKIIAVVLVLLMLPTGTVLASSIVSEGPVQFRSDDTYGVTVNETGALLVSDPHVPTNFTMLGDTTVPTSRSYSVMAFDEDIGESFMFGGNRFNDTWAFDAVAGHWTQMHPPLSPPTRMGSALVYDSVNKVLVLFGGWDTVNNKILNDTWTYDAKADKWTNITPVKSPCRHYYHAMDFDRSLGETILFGGDTVGYCSGNETWSFDTATRTWTNRTVPGSPKTRDGHSMAYDIQKGVSVMYGGTAGMWCQNDTWWYNATLGTWTNVTGPDVPGWRLFQKMVYDSVNHVTVMQGGQVVHNPGGDTWTYDSSTNKWTDRSTPGLKLDFYDHVMAFDTRKGVSIVGSFSGVRETWMYDAAVNKWDKWQEPNWPASRYCAGMAAAGGRVFLFGGSGYPNGLNDTWSLDPVTGHWTRMSPVLSPPARACLGMAYDPDDGILLVFGGVRAYLDDYSDTWAYNISAGTWTNMNPAVHPSARELFGLAYDQRDKVFILFGGTVDATNDFKGDTWAYDYRANNWYPRAPLGQPPVRFGPMMDYDPQGGVMIMFGGESSQTATWYPDDTWRYNYTANEWVQLHPSGSPTGRSNTAMAYASKEGVHLLYGTYYLQQKTSDMWSFNLSANAWTKRHVEVFPTYRDHTMGAYSPVSDSLVVFGGSWSPATYGDLWALNLTGYTDQGDLTSAPLDLGGPSDLGHIRWDATVPPGTGLAFQVRSAATLPALKDAHFLGPDGTEATRYTFSGQRLDSSINGSSWVQYRAFFTSANWSLTPMLRSVNLTYNVLPVVKVLSPAGGASCWGFQDIAWNVTDIDRGDLGFDLYLIDNGTVVPLVTGLPNGTRSWRWDLNGLHNGTFKVRVVARDADAEIPVTVNATSQAFQVWQNMPPSVELTLPPEGSLVSTQGTGLAWKGADDGPGPLKYSLYLSGSPLNLSSLPAPVAVDNATQYDTGPLAPGPHYWTVVASDGLHNGTVPQPWSFIARASPRVLLLSPENGSRTKDTTPLLSWENDQTGSGDVKYSLYLSKVPFGLSSLPGVETVTTNTSWTPAGPLSNGTTFYWAVVADNGVVKVPSEVHWFTVDITVGNRPPVLKGSATQNATVGSKFRFRVLATDPDGDNVTFGLETPVAGLSIGTYNGTIDWVPTMDELGQVHIKVVAMDEHGAKATEDLVIAVGYVWPHCTITTPSMGARLKGSVTANGTCTGGTRLVTRIQVRIDNDSWQTVAGSSGWALGVSTKQIKDGAHTITVRSFDGLVYSGNTTAQFSVSNKVVTVQLASSLWLWVLLVIIIVIIVALVAMNARGRKRPVVKEEDEEQVTDEGFEELPDEEEEKAPEDTDD